MEKSTHKAEVIKLVLEPHNNSDFLSIVRVHGYTVVVNTKDWLGKEKAIHILPESIVDTSIPEFSFLGKGDKVRIKPRKIRGVQSFGLLIPAPDDCSIGDDLAERFGITHYEPELDLVSDGDNISPPKELAYLSKYDVDSARRYSNKFKDGEIVYLSEKIHGANQSCSAVQGQLYTKSRTNWKAKVDNSQWWTALNNSPQIEEFCLKNEGLVIFGECYGKVQNYRYGLNTCKFAAYDIFDLKESKFFSAPQFLEVAQKNDIPTVSQLGTFSFNLEELAKLADGPSLMPNANHGREGIIIRPAEERWDDEIGRVILKVVGFEYLEKN